MISNKESEGISFVSSEKLNSVVYSKQADILINYLKEHPNLELDFSDKYGYMIDHPFAVTPSIFSSWGLSDEFDIKVSYKKLLL